MAAPPHSFPVDPLRGTSSRTILANLRKRCSHNEENFQLCSLVCEGIHSLHDAVAPLYQDSLTKRKYVDVLVRFIKLTHRDPLLQRLAASNTTRYRARELLFILDAVATDAGSTGYAAGQWLDTWVDAGEAQRSSLMEALSASNERALVNELTSERQIEEVLMMLYAGLETNEPPEFLKFKREVYNKVRCFLKGVGPEMFDWYIARDRVVVDHDRFIGDGTFGGVYHGSLMTQNGDIQGVVIKELYKEVTNDSNLMELFLKQLHFWNCLMQNPELPKTHILRLYGAVHIGKPQLYVCEDAANGNLLTFLGLEENLPLFWKMFLQVAEGLETLHAQGIVHGGLKCSNVLVSEDNTAKLSDFGFSFIRSLSIELSTQKNKAMIQSVRWKPKEMLQEMADAEFRFAGDVYSLGMCMIEAITQEPPFGWTDDDDIMPLIMSGEGHPRPDGVSDETWEFITQLCDSDFTTRMTLDEAIVKIRELATSEAGPAA